MPLDLPQTTEELQALLEEAGAAEMAMPGRGTRPAGYRSGMPEPVQDPSEAYGWTAEELPLPVPSARRIDAMDSALGWIALIPLDPPRRGSGMLHSTHGGAVLRRIVHARSYVNPRTGHHRFSWKRIADLLGCSKQSVANWHAKGLEMILARLHAQAREAAQAHRPGMRSAPAHLVARQPELRGMRFRA